MIRVVMLDLGETLVHEGRPFPFVPECLEALSGFVTSAGEPVERCIVSDFGLVVPFTEAGVAARFGEFLALLEQVSLRGFFEPVSRRVTISAQADREKPNAAVFRLALSRLGVDPDFGDCLFITENAEHIDACRELGFATLRFGKDAAGEEGFAAWPEGIVTIARRVAANRVENLEMALAVLAKAEQGFEDFHLIGRPDGQELAATAQAWVPIDRLELGPLGGLRVKLPVGLRVTGASHGTPEITETEPPSPEAIEEATQFVLSLHRQHRIETGEVGAPRATHGIEVDEQGHRLLKRRNFD